MGVADEGMVVGLCCFDVLVVVVLLCDGFSGGDVLSSSLCGYLRQF